MSRAREFADLAGSADAGGLTGRNLIINGAMQVAQRGTSSTTNGFGSLDRFQPLYGGGTITHSQETLTGDSPYNNGFRNFMRLTVTSAGSNSAADFCYISYKVEAQDVANSGWQYASSNSSVSIQFWVRTSVAGTYYTSLQSADGTARAFVFPVVLSANTWTKVTKAIPGDSSTLEFANDTGTGLQIIIRPHVGTNYSDSGVSTNSWYSRSGSTQTPDYTQNWQSTGSATFDLTGVQLEVGSATPFEHRSFGDELARCRRYTQVFLGDQNYSQVGVTGIAYSTTNLDVPVPLIPAMRSVPAIGASGTVQASNAGSGYTLTGLSIITAQSSTDVASLRGTTSGMTAATPHRMESGNNTTARVTLDAEL